MISSFLLYDIPRYDTRLLEVREAFKRTLLLGFRAYISAYFEVYRKKIAAGGPPGGPSGAPAGSTRRRRVARARCFVLHGALR